MIKELILKWALRTSEKEIARFLSLFSQGNAEQNGAVVGMAALLHHQYAQKDRNRPVTALFPQAV